MTFDEITQEIQAIQQLAQQDMTDALERNKRLFLELCAQNQAYILPETPDVPEDAFDQKKFRPYIAPVKDDDPRSFLRLFSHEEAARSFSEKMQMGQPVSVDGVETLQLARFYFLRGVSGFLLNDGLDWATISFPDFLTSFYAHNLGDPSFGSAEFIALVQVINMVRQNHFYHIVIFHANAAEESEKVSLLDSRHLSGLDPSQMEEGSLPRLAQLAKEECLKNVGVKVDDFNFEVSSEQFQTVLQAAGVTERVQAENDFDFHTNSVSLCFETPDDEIVEDLEDLEEDAELLGSQNTTSGKPTEPSETEDSETEVEKPSKTKQKKEKGSLFARLKETVLAKKDTMKKEESSPKKSIFSKWIIKGTFAAAFLIIAVFLLSSLFKSTPAESVQKMMEAGNYGELPEAYQDCVGKDPDTREVLLPLAQEDLQKRLNDYAADAGTAADLEDAIRAYQQIPATKEAADAVYQQAGKLEQSKLAYQKGLLETSILARLEDWRAVLAADVGSQKAMQKNLEENQKIYRDSVFVEVSDLSVKSALSGLYLLQSYYPDDSKISDKIKECTEWEPNATASTGTSPLLTPPFSAETKPISIQSIHCQQTSWEGKMDLFLNWRNTSGKEIESVVFLVVPLDASGKELSTLVEGTDGAYSRYAATAQGPFPPEFQMTDKWVWESAWVNPSIAEVRLDSVSIAYSDGESVSITNIEALESLFENQDT